MASGAVHLIGNLAPAEDTHTHTHTHTQLHIDRLHVTVNTSSDLNEMWLITCLMIDLLYVKEPHSDSIYVLAFILHFSLRLYFQRLLVPDQWSYDALVTLCRSPEENVGILHFCKPQIFQCVISQVPFWHSCQVVEGVGVSWQLAKTDVNQVVQTFSSCVSGNATRYWKPKKRTVFTFHINSARNCIGLDTHTPFISLYRIVYWTVWCVLDWWDNSRK